MIDPVVTASLISGGSQLLGGLFGSKSADSRNDLALAFAREQMAAQKEFAQQGIRWRVDDAKAAGIHPLYALGASTPSFSPATYMPEGPSYGLGQAVADAGQNIGRAIDSTRTATERLNVRLLESQVEGSEIDNAIRRSQLRILEQGGGTPPGPSTKAGIEIVPIDPVSHDAEGNRVLTLPDGSAVRVPGYVNNAEDFEQEFGDIIQELHGFGHAGSAGYDYLKRRVLEPISRWYGS